MESTRTVVENLGETSPPEPRHANKPPQVSLPRRLARAAVSCRRATVFALELEGGFPTVERDDVRWHWVIDPSDPLIGLLDEPEVVRAAVARGDGVSVAMNGERFASRLAVSLQSFREPFMGVRVHLQTGNEAWLGEMHTDLAFRRRGLARDLGATTMNSLGAMGITTLYLSAEDWNEASTVLSLRQGFKPVAEFRFIRVFRRWGFLVPGSVKPRVRPLVR